MTILRTLSGVMHRLVEHAKDRGAGTVVFAALNWGVQWLLGKRGAARISGETFEWENTTVPYFYHRYNYTWLNERAVELPLALDVLRQHEGQDILEVGNVTGRYVPVNHLVVDKYERAPGVVNADVVDLDLDDRFDLVLAVSTLEHVGLDEEVKDPEKAAAAVERLKGLLKPGGRLWMTLPVGYNPDLDGPVQAGRFAFTDVGALLRDEHRNRWRQVSVEQIWNVGYDRLLYTAHGVVIAEFVAEGRLTP